MFFSGISDEAGQTIERQIQAHQELGWKHLELRLVDGQNFTQVSDAKYDEVRAKIDDAGLQVSCFGSAIANWARPITCDPDIDIEDLRRAIPRMRQMNVPFIRVMSYPNDKDHPVSDDQWRKEAISRMKTLAKMAEDGGIMLAHENCSGWGGLSAENSNILLAEVNSPALKVVFDTGNPVSYGQDAWDYYRAVYPDIVYVHIKDAKRAPGAEKEEYCYCGDGPGYVREIVGDLLSRGYDGGFSIEPHLAAIIHTGQQANSDEQLYRTYTEYGRRLMRIVEEAKARA
ncbi:MAG: sugar phosphate isomerase/epimerase [Candidatus Hydrogenedentes bacterium]|nr:sugar phosphate isomerase/epimerase [Candidatus Hydrogenedentota bacterium]